MSYGLRKRKVKEVPQEEEEIEQKVTKKRVRISKKNRAAKEVKVLEEVITSNEPDLDITKTCPNEIIVHILSFLTYKEVLGTFYDKRWLTLGNSRELWGMFCRKMRWSLPLKNKKMTYKDLFMKRISSKTFCSSCGCKTTAKFPLLQITLCPTCRSKEPEFATLNKTQSKAQYFLDDYDLSKVKFVVSNVGWGRKKYVYLKSDIEAAAYEKFGGVEGFEQERAKRTQIKQSKFTILALKKERRAQDLEESLESIGWSKTFALGTRKFPILLPTELFNDDYDRYLRAPAKGKPTASFANVFVLNCYRYLNTGFGALFIENLPLLDDIEAYLLRERESNPTTASDTTSPTTTTTTTTATTTATTTPTGSTTPTTSTTSIPLSTVSITPATPSAPTTPTTSTATTTTAATTTTTTTTSAGDSPLSTPPTDAPSTELPAKNPATNSPAKTPSTDSPAKSPAKTPAKLSVSGKPLTTYAGAIFDGELRQFYINLLYARIEQIWQHPGRFDIEPEPVDEDDHMGVLFDKKAHFCKRLRTPNKILEQIYDDARSVMDDHDHLFDSDSEDDEEGNGFSLLDLFGGGCLCPNCNPFWGDDDDDDDSDSDDFAGMF